jgi:hypothetical protein
MTSRIAILLALAASACTPRLLPGTEIHSNPDTRAIYDVLQRYRQAMEMRDASAVLALVAPDYFDTAGTPQPDDDADRGVLEKRLPEDLANVDTLKLELTVRKIDVDGDHAEAEVFYDEWYRAKTPAGGIAPRRDSDVHRMRLRRIEGSWKFTSGL